MTDEEIRIFKDGDYERPPGLTPAEVWIRAPESAHESERTCRYSPPRAAQMHVAAIRGRHR